MLSDHFKILYIDNNEGRKEKFDQLFSNTYSIRYITNEFEALDELEKIRYDLIIIFSQHSEDATVEMIEKINSNNSGHKSLIYFKSNNDIFKKSFPPHINIFGYEFLPVDYKKMRFLIWSAEKQNENERKNKKLKSYLSSNLDLLKESQRLAKFGYLFWDLQTNEIDWSEEVYRIYGVESGVKPDIGFTVSLVHPEDFEYVQKNLNLAIQQVKPYDIEHRIMRPSDKKVIWIHAKAKLDFDADGKPLTMIGTVLDVTDRKAAFDKKQQINKELEDLVKGRTLKLEEMSREMRLVNIELEKSIEKEKELSEMKSRFATMVSHEFRTPLSSIQLAAGYLRKYYDKINKDAFEKKLSKIERQISNMTIMLDDVLLLGKSEAQKIRFNPSKLPIEKYIRTIVDEVSITMDVDRSVKFDFCLASPYADLDPDLGRNIFINLLTNAFKYSDEKIIVNVKSSLSQLEVEVIDQGIGMSNSNDLFMPFQRGNNVSEIQGSGLGLSIVEQAVQLHNGEIKVVSKLNKGTSISIVIPQGQSSQ